MTNQETNNVRLLSNEDPALFGKNAGANWIKGATALGNGDQLAIMACAIAYASVNFNADVLNSKGSFERRIIFNLKHYLNKEVKTAAGKRDNKATQARSDAVMSHLFGIEPGKWTSNMVTRVRAAIQVVEYLFAKGYGIDRVQWDEKKKCLSIPYAALYAVPKADAKDEAKEQFEMWKDKNILLTGAKVDNKLRTVSSLQAMAADHFNKGKGTNNKTKSSPAVELAKSVELVTLSVSLIMDPNKKAGKLNVNAFSPKMRKQLFDLNSALSGYFKADPMEAKAKRATAPRRTGTEG